MAELTRQQVEAAKAMGHMGLKMRKALAIDMLSDTALAAMDTAVEMARLVLVDHTPVLRWSDGRRCAICRNPHNPSYTVDWPCPPATRAQQVIERWEATDG